MCINKMFSNYLKAERKKAGLTQVQLADKISGLGYKISNGLISYYETDYGKKNKGWSNRPPEDFINVLCLALNLDESEARNIAGYASQQSSIPPEIAALDFSGFSADGIAEIVSFIKFKQAQEATKDIIGASLKQNSSTVREIPIEEIEDTGIIIVSEVPNANKHRKAS